MGVNLTDMAGSRYGSLQFLLDQFAAQQDNREDHEVASDTNDEESEHPASPYGLCSLSSDDDADVFDVDFCTSSHDLDPTTGTVLVWPTSTVV